MAIEAVFGKDGQDLTGVGNPLRALGKGGKREMAK
jgi:hypothetical protein